MTDRGAADPRWTVIVPVKRFAEAKTRLDVDREAFARAFAADTTNAVAGTGGVVRVVVVTTEAGPILVPEGGVLVRQLSRGIASAIEEGLAASPESRTGPVAVVLADLPSLTPPVFTGVLADAARHDAAYVPDLEGSGTTVLTARAGALLRPAFGVYSARRHRRAGAVPLAAGAAARRDVDTRNDLLHALRIGVGHSTATVARTSVGWAEPSARRAAS